MQAIHTKYFGPTNKFGTRIKASCEAKTMYLPWSHNKNPEENHKIAAEVLARNLKWIDEATGRKQTIFSGSLPDGTWAHVLVPITTC